MIVFSLSFYHCQCIQNRELERRVQEVKEQEWNKIAGLQQDKIQLEEELSKAQEQNANSLSNQQALTNKFCDEIRQLEIDKVMTCVNRLLLIQCVCVDQFKGGIGRITITVTSSGWSVEKFPAGEEFINDYSNGYEVYRSCYH